MGGGCVPGSPLITWLDHLMGRMGDFQCTGLFASASKKGFHARLICACLQRREYAPLFPPPTLFCLGRKDGHGHTTHTQHTYSKVVEMVLVEALRGGSCPHIWLQYFPPGISDQAVPAGPHSLVLSRIQIRLMFIH